jgi:hypothetical protein
MPVEPVEPVEQVGVLMMVTDSPKPSSQRLML